MAAVSVSLAGAVDSQPVSPVKPSAAPAFSQSQPSPRGTLTTEQWEQSDHCIDRALAWLATQQGSDGSFPTKEIGQPGVTGLCVLAFLARGHTPGRGDYGGIIAQGVEYVLQCQQPDGLIARVYPRENRCSLLVRAAVYNHAIGGLTLAETYGMTTGEMSRRILSAIEPALAYARKRRPQPKRRPADKGGWRYAKHCTTDYNDSDLSVTSWHLMFLRSCQNSGFEVPSVQIDEALAYVHRCFDPRNGTFRYALHGRGHGPTRAMTGAGILSLSLGGRHQTQPAREAGEWLLRHPFNRYLEGVFPHDRFFYGAFYCSQGMFQLGDRYWEGFYPILLQTLAGNQNPAGYWDRETWATDAEFGQAYTTALAVLALSPPYQLLPIFQR